MDRLQSMRVFQRVSDEGSFASAARALDLSPAAVTRLVADLEEGLGVRLLHRTTRRLALTQAGEAYLARVRRILQDIDEADAQASAHTVELSGDLRISAPATLATHVLAPLVAGFRAQYPGVRLDIEVGTGGHGSIEEYDLTLFGAEAGFDAAVIARPILEADAVLVAAPAYLRARGMPQQPADLAQHEVLINRHGGPRSSSLRLWPAGRSAELVEVPVQPALSVNNGDALLRAVLAGGGISSFALDLVAPYLSSGELLRVLSPWVTGRLTVYAAMPSRRFVPERARRFLDYLAQQTQQQAAAALAACEACRAQWQPTEDEVGFIEPDELMAARATLHPPLLLDVRSAISPPRADDDIAGARRVDLGQVVAALADLPRDTPLVTLCPCPADAGAIAAARELAAAGYQAVRVLRGGVAAWHAAQAVARPRAARRPQPALAG